MLTNVARIITAMRRLVIVCAQNSNHKPETRSVWPSLLGL